MNNFANSYISSSILSVIVAMSGGVDSSVTAKLLTEQVRLQLLQYRAPFDVVSRTMTYLLSSCATGIPATNRVLIRAANGKRTGKMSGGPAGYWTFLAKWYAVWQLQ